MAASRSRGDTLNELTDITPLQSRILDILWDAGPATTAEVRRGLGEEEYARTTVATLLSRMHRYGWLSRERDGREYLYAAAVRKSAVRRAQVQQLIRSLFAGDLPSLLSHALEEGDWSEGDLEEIEHMLEDRRVEEEG